MKCIFFGVSRPSLGVPWENRGRRATPNSIVSLWTVSRNCCVERCALYSEGVGLHRDRFQSLRLLKISGSWRPSVTREHFTQEWVREEWGHSESWGSPTGHETEFQIITEKWARVCADCLCGNPLPRIECFSWNHSAPGGSLLETRLEGVHPFGPLELAESDVWICHSPLLYKVWAQLLSGLCWPDWGGWICWAPFPAPSVLWGIWCSGPCCVQGRKLLGVSTAPAPWGLCSGWAGTQEAAGRKMDNVSSFPQGGRCWSLMTKYAITS